MTNEDVKIRDKFLSVFASLILTREQIIDMIMYAFPDNTNRSSIMPSDYCYNAINQDPSSFKIHLFEMLGDGNYRYLGQKYPYSGKILWNRKEVGSWENGIYELLNDPRSH